MSKTEKNFNPIQSSWFFTSSYSCSGYEQRVFFEKSGVGFSLEYVLSAHAFSPTFESPRGYSSKTIDFKVYMPKKYIRQLKIVRRRCSLRLRNPEGLNLTEISSQRLPIVISFKCSEQLEHSLGLGLVSVRVVVTRFSYTKQPWFLRHFTRILRNMLFMRMRCRKQQWCNYLLKSRSKRFDLKQHMINYSFGDRSYSYQIHKELKLSKLECCLFSVTNWALLHTLSKWVSIAHICKLGHICAPFL